MFDTATSLFIGIAPWGLGVAMLYALLHQFGRWRLENHLFVIGSGAYMGYLWIALLMAGLQRHNIPVFTDWLLAWMLLSVVGCWSLGMMTRLSTNRVKKENGNLYSPTRLREPLWLIAGLTGWLAATTIAVYWEAALRPAVAWDTTHFWADHGHAFLTGQLDTANLTGMSSRIHPVTIKYVGAWGSFALHERSATGLYLPWAALHTGTTIVCIALGKIVSGKWWLGLAAALLVATTPLMQAQTSLGGYADFWLTSGLFLSLAWLAVANRSDVGSTPVLQLIIALLILSLSLLKGNAVIYSIALLGSMILAWTWTKWHWTAILTISITFLLTVTWLWTRGFELSFAGYQIAYLPRESHIALGQRSAVISNNSWAEIARNFSYAWMHNSSFYLLALLGLILPALSMTKHVFRHDWTLLTSLFLLASLIVFFSVGQHLNEQQLFAYAAPGSDTSLSRFSQVMSAPIVLILILLGSKFIAQRPNFKGARYHA